MNILKKIPKMDVLKVTLFIFLFISIVLPIFVMLFQINPSDLNKVFIVDNFFGLFGNSMLYTTITTFIVLIVSLTAAYLLNKSNIKHKTVFVVLFTVPMLIPSISHGLGIINIFGANGFLDKLLGIKLEAYGLFGLVLASFLYSFPVAFLMFYDSLRYMDNRIFEASETLGINKFQQFIYLILPNIKTVIGSVIFAVFTMVFTDYGVPLAVAGNFKTLPVYLYQEVISRLNFSKGIIVSISLLVPAVIAFIYDLIVKKSNAIANNSVELKQTKAFNITSICFNSFISLIILLPILSFAIMSFVKSFPNDMTPTFEHFDYIINYGAFDYLANSLIIALLTSLLGVLSAYFIAYLSTRIESKTSKILHFVTITSMAIPGIVLGLSYIFLFKSTFLYGTILILVLVNIVHFIATPYLMAKNALDQIDKNYEVVGATLGISRLKILTNVVLPCSVLTLIEMFSYFFVNAMITISAVSFLASIFDMPISLLIPVFESQLSYEAAAIISLIILIINLLIKLLINAVIKYLKKGKLRYAN